MNVTIKALPAPLHRKLKARAQLNKRSLNGEVIDILERSLESKPVDVEALLDQVQRIHILTFASAENPLAFHRNLMLAQSSRNLLLDHPAKGAYTQ